jgi:hypothetical protein
MAFIGNNVQVQGFTPAVDYFSGNGSTVTFTLSRPVVSVAQMIVSVANVVQNPSSAYTVSGSAITFTSAPPSGTNNIWVEYTSLITTYAAISQSPSVIGDITASGGYLATGNFNNSFIDGTIVDYVTGNGRITAGPADGITLYNGGTSARTALAAWDASGNLTNTGSIGSPAATALTLKSAGTTALTIDTSQNVCINTTNNSNTGAVVEIQAKTGQSGLAINGFSGENARLALRGVGGGLTGISSNTTLYFAPSNTEAMRIDTNGSVLIGKTSTGITTNGYVINAAGDISQVFGAGNYSVINSQTGASTWVSLRNANSEKGSIVINSGSVSYNTTSDYRLKENVTPITDALTKVSLLKPVNYTWKDSGEPANGFIAHELQEVAPDCVTGEKDAVDADGNPKYQAIDTSFLTATLVKAIQELNAKVIALEAKLEAK